MSVKPSPPRLPSVDAVLCSPTGTAAVAGYGHQAATAHIRETIAAFRQDGAVADAESVARAALRALAAAGRPSLRRVFNLTGTVLHTNLGRAILAETAIEAAMAAMRHAANLEFDLGSGKRGERDDHVRWLIRELTGAEDALVVNNNAAAVLLVLAALAAGREVIVSRGELIEIGGSFRMPAIMASAGATLVEVGTTNRTHLRDYSEAIGTTTALMMKVHTSNYRIEGFTADVAPRDLAALARQRGVPFVDDLGSGTLVDFGRYGLAPERTVIEAVKDGADLVTFSGDKLLGGPQAGFIVGRKELVEICARHPMKRAMRLDKVRLAALEATLKLYRDPDRLPDTLPTLRYLTRTRADIAAQAQRLAPALSAALGPDWSVETVDCASQIGSGSLPLETLPSAGLACTPPQASGRTLEQLAARLRALPVPIVARLNEGRMILDLRCLDDEAGFLASLRQH